MSGLHCRPVLGFYWETVQDVAIVVYEYPCVPISVWYAPSLLSALGCTAHFLRASITKLQFHYPKIAPWTCQQSCDAARLCQISSSMLEPAPQALTGGPHPHTLDSRSHLEVQKLAQGTKMTLAKPHGVLQVVQAAPCEKHMAAEAAEVTQKEPCCTSQGLRAGNDATVLLGNFSRTAEGFFMLVPAECHSSVLEVRNIWSGPSPGILIGSCLYRSDGSSGLPQHPAQLHFLD